MILHRVQCVLKFDQINDNIFILSVRNVVLEKAVLGILAEKSDSGRS